jgi:hypothetical protein
MLQAAANFIFEMENKNRYISGKKEFSLGAQVL